MEKNILFLMPGGIELLIIIIPLAFWIFALVDCIKSEFTHYNKVLWLVIILMAPFIGSILYFILSGTHKIRRIEKPFK